MTITHLKAQKAKPGDKPYKLADGKGLFLLVEPTGSKHWRYRFKVHGRESMLSLGQFPEVGLEDARGERLRLRCLVKQGVHPGAARRLATLNQRHAAGSTFEIVAREWHGKKLAVWSEAHAKSTLARLQRNVFPWLGGRPVADIKASEVLACLRRIEAAGKVETAHRVREHCGEVLRYAVGSGRAERDVTVDLKGQLTQVQHQHIPAITDPKELGDLLRAIDGYDGTFPVQCALKLAPLLFQRPGELRQMQWADVDLVAAHWRYLVTKTDTPHLVPLSAQALTILRELHRLTGEGRYVFPGIRDAKKPMSENTLNVALNVMGYKGRHRGHGFRATMRTIADEVLGIRPEYIEHQMAHAVRDPLGRAYNRTAHLEARRKMMQQWADYLERLAAGDAKVVPIRAAA